MRVRGGRSADARAQSTVLGTILLLAVVVLVVSVVAAGTLYPALQDSREPLADLQPTVTTETVRLTHAGGDSFEATSLTVYLLPGATDGIPFEDDFPEDRFDPGEVWERNATYDRGEQIRVLVVHEPTDDVITDEYVRAERARN